MGQGWAPGVVLLTLELRGEYAEIALRPREAMQVAQWIQETIATLTERDVKYD